jgi:hypothetical protein
MPANRIQTLFPVETPAVVVPAASSAFVSCPCPVALMMTPAQQAFAAEVYRLAYERTQAQLRPAVRELRFTAFSLN